VWKKPVRSPDREADAPVRMAVPICVPRTCSWFHGVENGVIGGCYRRWGRNPTLGIVFSKYHDDGKLWPGTQDGSVLILCNEESTIAERVRRLLEL
jgi:hypothetical protein